MEIRRKTEIALLLAIVIVGGAVRSYCLGTKGLWNDEILIAVAVRQPTLAETLHKVWMMFGATPLLTLIELPLPRDTHPEFWARLPSAVAGILAIPAIFLLGRRLAGGAAGLGAALLLAVSPFHVYFSQHARFYSLFTTLVIFQMIALLRAVDRPVLSRWVSFFGITSLCFYAGYYTLIMLMLEAGVLLIAGHLIPWRAAFRKTGVPFIVSSLAAFAAFLPWFLYHSTQNINAMFGPPPGFIRPILATVQEFGPVDPMTFPLIYIRKGFKLPGAGSILFLLFAFCGIIQALRRRDMKGCFIAVPILVSIPFVVAFETWVTSFFYRPKQVIFILPLYLIAVASGALWLSGLARRFSRPLAYAAFLFLVIPCLLATGSYLKREEHQGFRPAARYLRAHRKPGEPVGLHQGYYLDVFSFYYPEGAIPLESMEAVREVERGNGWFVTIMERTDFPEIGDYIYATKKMVARWHPDPEFPEIRIYREEKSGEPR